MSDTPTPQPSQLSQAQMQAFMAARSRIDRVNDWLLVGGGIPASESDKLAAAGVSHIVDLRVESEFEPADVEFSGIERNHTPVENHHAPTMEQLQGIDQWIQDQAPEGVYVHCVGGFGRGPSVAVGLLVYRGASIEEAEAQVRSARPETMINDEQRAWLEEVERQRP